MADLGIRSAKLSVSIRMETEKLVNSVGMQKCNKIAINLKFYV
jgi:hypothetical protein